MAVCVWETHSTHIFNSYRYYKEHSHQIYLSTTSCFQVTRPHKTDGPTLLWTGCNTAWQHENTTNLNLSCPAVSQICSLTTLPPTLTSLLPNSTPIVCVEFCLTVHKHSNTTQLCNSVSKWQFTRISTAAIIWQAREIGTHMILVIWASNSWLTADSKDQSLMYFS